jgi:hypothetical protein
MSRCQFHKTFYDRNLRSSGNKLVHFENTSRKHASKDGLAYFDKTVSYDRKMFTNLTAEHCQNPASYVAREQEVSSSINSYQSPVPSSYQAEVAPLSTYQGGSAPPPPPPPPPSTYRQPYQQSGQPQRKRQTPGQPPARPSPKNYQVTVL